MKLRAPICLLLLATHAAGAEPWPGSFRFQCGDIRHKVPYDVRDGGTLVPIFSGEAVRMAPGELSGYYARGLGYQLKAVLQDEKLTGTPAAVSMTFTCQTRDPADTSTDNRMTCRSDLQTAPGFQPLTASLPVPGDALAEGQGPGTLSIRHIDREETADSQMFRFYQTVREVSCNYVR